ncbi:hypothetical protein MTO98_09510 [Mucilaginibacter sp. SMC90]|uniref:hypothetical protein n=1 Tax=Mucilaginibacter sp. SMC90 TaxID=2929803 RepID=UPI001FB2B0E1|nr:hypothetical protein [Mucilaginibacter sp. SMC90]UOE51314.1 hypothetical protein MTO98_09510 [Mucilaginibacter sp. SMC90]
MKTQYHFQIRKNGNHSAWDLIKAHKRCLPDWQTAVCLAKRAARCYHAEIRLTEGRDPSRANGHYFRSSEA